MNRKNNSATLPEVQHSVEVTRSGAVPTIECMRAKAAHHAALWTGNVDDLRTSMPLLEWRDDCRDGLAYELWNLGRVQMGELLTAWTETFDAATGEELAALRDTVSDGRYDIDCAISVARDLLALALSEGAPHETSRCRANAAIRAAKRYLDNIAQGAAFIDGWMMAEGGAA